MRIYGKTLSEIFSLLPLPYKAVVVMGAAFCIFALPYSMNYFVNMSVGGIDRVEPMAFPGLSRANKGVTDPAIATDGNQVLMAHTVLNASSSETDSQMNVEVALERAEKPCRSWMFIPGGYESKSEEITMPDGTPLPAGRWRAETPAVVYDPDAPVDRRWQTYAYRYYWASDSEKLARYMGFIAAKTSPDAGGPWKPEERWLFSAGTVQTETGVITQPPAPYDSLVQYKLNDMSPELKDVYFYSRPSVIYVKAGSGGFLFMTLSAFTRQSKTPDRIVMLKSVDHGLTWSYVGIPLRVQDLPKMKGQLSMLGGASLIQYQDRVYLAAVLGNDSADGLGAFMLPFDKITQGLLQRDEKGVPVQAWHHPRNSIQPSKIGGGYAAYSDACRQGMIMSEYSDITQSFQIFKTHKKPVPAQ